MTVPRAPLALAVLLASWGAAGGQETTVGWRGDGTGKYPAAHPPLTWSRVSRAVQGLRHRAARPKESDVGEPMPDGVIREWLVLSPAPEGGKADKEVLPDEAGLDPDRDETCGGGAWKSVRLETAWLDFNGLLGKTDKRIGCAITHLFSDTGGKFRVNATQLSGFQMVLNGKPVPPGYGRYSIDLVKGWNRLLVKVAPRESDWAFALTLHARSPAEYSSTNIAWMVPLPGVTGGFYGGGTGCSSPVIVGDRIYLLSESHDLICLRKTDGKVLWVKTNNYYDAATAEDREKPACSAAGAIARELDALNASLSSGPLQGRQLEEKVKLEKALYAKMQEVDDARYTKQETPDVGFSGLTPVSDGKSLYLWLGTGVTASYDLDGRRRWIRSDNLPAVEHGFSSSPLLVDGKVVVFMRDVMAFDAGTGSLAWRIPLVSHEGANPGGFFHGTPARIEIGRAWLIVLGNGTIVRSGDGKVLFTHPEMGNQAISSPVVEGDLLFETSTGSMKLFIHQLPREIAEPFAMSSTRAVSVDTPEFPRYYMPWHIASPLVHEGLAYLLNNAGVLTVVDVNEGKVLDRRMVDLDHFQTSNEGPARGIGISPALAGGYLYLLGNSGAAVVLEPGRAFRQVAKNKIENLVSIGHWGERQERFVANPVFDGERLYIRGEGNLYAIAAGAAPVNEPPPEARTGVASAAALPRPRDASRPGVAVHLSHSPARPRARGASGSTQYGWRGDGSGVFPDATPPDDWSEKRNVKWRTAVGNGYSSPIIAADRVIVLSEPGTLLCLGRADGKLLWQARVDDDLPEELRGMVREVPGTKERARATPVTDGKSIYVSLCTGIVASYTVDGKRRWVQYVPPAALSFGPSASPVLAGDTLLVDSTRLRALDASTGRLLWTAEGCEPHYGTPAVISLGGTSFAVGPKGAVVRISDGAVLARKIAEGLGGDQAPSPIVVDDVVYFTYRRASAVRLTLEGNAIRPEKLWERELPGDIVASPVLTDGMLFVVPAGSPDYRVLDALTGEVLLEKELDLPGSFFPSLALAGNRLYLGNDKGDTLVLEPARTYREIRRNELPEGSGASAAFAGSNLFLRGGEHLYCIGR